MITNHGRALVRVVAEVPSQVDRSRAFGSLKHLLADLPADWDSAEHQNELSRRFEHVQELMERACIATARVIHKTKCPNAVARHQHPSQNCQRFPPRQSPPLYREAAGTSGEHRHAVGDSDPSGTPETRIQQRSRRETNPPTRSKAPAGHHGPHWPSCHPAATSQRSFRSHNHSASD